MTAEAARRYRQTENGKERQRIRTFNRYWENRSKLDQIKLESGCVDCGYNTHPAALQFDHVRGEKLFNVGGALGNPWSRIALEIEKCEVVCANCHAVRTANRRVALNAG